VSSSASSHHVTRPLDAAAIAVMLVLCLSWGFNQVSVKIAIHEIPPMTQAAMIEISGICAHCRAA